MPSQVQKNASLPILAASILGKNIRLSNVPFVKDIYTRVLKGHIAVSFYKLKKNSNGSDVDKNARKPLKKIVQYYNFAIYNGDKNEKTHTNQFFNVGKTFFAKSFPAS